ncbi:hypothetical protein LTR36_009662 [Oleoguttula mirabilis]|uniref:Uncharacterized protein n=1 Tax=Oleoguttula mirabilis TaxID=1507867 RepID=A0AAV9J5K2_9PEZI|nr:hypothetical protein LTR36_009662 [Oleoguttula mirabilis]
MAVPSRSTHFGASIVPTQQRPEEEGILRPPPMLDSPTLTPVVSREEMASEYTDKPIPPHSPFYQHPPASFERVHSLQTSKTNIATTTYEKDLEGGHATPLTAADDNNPFTSKISVDHNKECQMWPSKNTLLQQRTREKQKRNATKGCAGCVPAREWWAKFDKRQQLYFQIAIALVLVGVAVAIGVGISKAVHGTYYGKNGSQQTVGGSTR